jgi:hypothetical protein
MGIKWYKEPTIISLLLGGFPLKNMSSSVGMIVPIYGKINMFQTTNQVSTMIFISVVLSICSMDGNEFSSSDW